MIFCHEFIPMWGLYITNGNQIFFLVDGFSKLDESGHAWCLPPEEWSRGAAASGAPKTNPIEDCHVPLE